jgi:excisionase family DNA binding protein
MSQTVTVQEAASLMKIHNQTLLDMIGRCELPAAKIGRSYVLLEKDVLAYIENQVIRQTATRMRSPERRSQITTA